MYNIFKQKTIDNPSCKGTAEGFNCFACPYVKDCNRHIEVAKGVPICDISGFELANKNCWNCSAFEIDETDEDTFYNCKENVKDSESIQFPFNQDMKCFRENK